MDRLNFDVTDHIAHIEMVREDKINALDGTMIDALIEAGERLKSERGIRVAVLSGRGRGFCAGLDMSNFTKMAEGDNSGITNKRQQMLAERTHGLANRPQKMCWTWREAPVPVIAAVHGVVLGGGFQIMLGADLRYAAPKTKFSIMEIRWGIIPDVGTTQMMQQLARQDIVKELALTGRIFESDEALEYGFLTRIVDDPLTASMEVATAIASRNPDATRGIKRLFNTQADRHAADNLLMESVIQDGIIGHSNQIEAVRAEFEKRTANFED